MGESRRPVKNVRTHEVKLVPLGQYRSYVTMRDRDTRRQVWEPLSDMSGVQTLPDGTLEQVVIPRDKVSKAAEGGIAFDIWEGDQDPRWEIARQQAVERKKKEIAAQRGMGTALDSALSVVTFGATSAIANKKAGEDAEMYRAMQIQQNPMAHLGGRVAGIVALGAAPILGGAGKAAGIANAGSIFEGSAALAQTARSLITGSGFLKDFSRRVVGTMVFGAASEVPLSAALAMADIVDNDKPLTAEVIASEWGTQFAYGMGIAAATGIPFSLVVSGFQAAGRGAVRGLQSDAMQSIIHGSVRYVSRAHLRGRLGGGGDILETAMHKAGSKIAREAAENSSRSAVGRWLAGAETDNFIKWHKSVEKGIRSLVDANTPKQLKEAAETIGYNVSGRDSLVMARDLKFIADNAKDIVEAKRFASILPKQVQEISAAAADVRLKMPPGANFRKGAKVSKEIESIMNDLAHVERGALQKTLADYKAPRNYAAAFNEAAELRRQMSATGKARVANTLKAVVDRKTASRLDDIFAQIDGFDANRAGAASLADDMTKAFGVRSVAQMEQLRASVQGLGGSYRGLVGENVVRNPKAMKRFFDGDELRSSLRIANEFDDVASGIEALGRANKTFSSLMRDASPLLARKRPLTQQEILEAQLETVVNFKKRVSLALEFIAKKGGGGRHTLAFGGVMAFREMDSMADKRAAFAAYREAIIASTATPQAEQELVGSVVGEAAMYDMELGVNLAETIATQGRFLSQQLPRSSDPIIDAGDFSPAEIENFFEYLGAASDPVSVLATAADASISDAAVHTVRTLYPGVYAEMVVDVAEFLDKMGNELGHEQLLGLDAFLGYALGYSDGPAPNLTMQAPYAQTSQQAAAIGGPQNRRMTLQQTTTPAQKVGAL